mmetsp:Transcript_43965/g.80334  ORF Transcript_43965/g.80334 Transcript_43965/m.80334 type:complete len:93 (-) Transcript_43965:51-329(-)
MVTPFTDDGLACTVDVLVRLASQDSSFDHVSSDRFLPSFAASTRSHSQDSSWTRHMGRCLCCTPHVQLYLMFPGPRAFSQGPTLDDMLHPCV